MELDSQNPYEINEEAPLDYTFVNRDGIKYRLLFIRLNRFIQNS